MYCPKCNKKFDEDSKFCRECGGNLSKNEKNNLEPASQGKRFLNFLLDIIFYFIFTIIFTIIFAFIVGIFGYASTIENYNDTFSTIFALIIMIMYYLLFETIYGKSIAKFITKTKVVNRDGSKPKFLTILWRTLARFIPFDSFSFCTGNKPIGWHDSISKTLVIDDK